MLDQVQMEMLAAIEENKRLKEELDRMNEAVRYVLEMHQGISFKIHKEKDTYRYIWSIGQLDKKLGFLSEDLTGMTVDEIFEEKNKKFLTDYYDKAFNGEFVQYETTYGNITYFVSIMPIYRDGQVAEALATCIDITSRKKVDEELRSVKELFETIFQHSADAIAIYDLNDRIIDVNEAFVRMFGWSKEEISGSKFPLSPPEKHLQLQECYDRIKIGPDSYIEYDDLKLCRDGTVLCTNVKLSAVKDNQGNVVAISQIIRDITDSKRVILDLHNNQRVLAQAQRLAHIGSWQWNAHKRKFIWSEELYQILGIQSSDIPEPTFDHFRDFVLPEDRDNLNDARQKLKKGISVNLEVRIIRKDGAVRHLHLISESETFAKMRVGVIQDITERKLSEQKHRMVKEQLESFIRNNSDSITIFDFDMNVIDANGACEKMYGWTKEELVQIQPLSRTVPEHLREENKRLFEQVRRGIPVVGYETVRYRRNGEIIYISLSLSPILDATGNIVMLSSVSRDITERKRTEEFLLQSEKLSVAGLLAAGIAHEIRNPLTSLKGFTQLLQATDKDNHSKENYYEIMLSELHRIETIVTELLVLAKPQAVVFEKIRISELLENVLGLLKSEALLYQVEILSDIEPLPCSNCNSNQLKQVFVNILKNGIQAMPNGGRLEVKLTRNGNQAEISFIDYGQGMSEETLKKIGEPFYTTKQNGTGLGLMVSKKIIQEHNGSILFQSTVGLGTRVAITLPLLDDVNDVNHSV